MNREQNSALNWALLQTLESLHEAGVQQLPAARPRTAMRAAASPPPAEAAATPEPPPQRKLTMAGPEDRILGQEADDGCPAAAAQAAPLPAEAELELLRAEVAHCALCQQLASTRKQTVFGVGNPNARLCLLGEAPGAEEDRQGEPFVGPAGALLNKILAACKLSRDDVYILNVLKCRPPGNRNPLPEEVQNCRGFLDRQLSLIAPQFICCLGAVAAQNLLGTSQAIGRLRGRMHDYQGIQVVCTYHPAYLLRNPSAKRLTWDDIQLLMREMGTPVT